MAYSDDGLRSKLASLNETQDSIVANAQWIMFHRRHAARTAQLWLERLQTCPPQKKLNLIYLANEVVQQSRARGKQDFLLAFEPIVAEATGVAYKGASVEVQGKIRRVVDVWKQRGIFDARILEQVETTMSEIERSRSAKSGGKLGGSLFGGSANGSGGSVPAELEGISKSQVALTKASVAVPQTVDTAEKEYAKMTDPNAVLPTPPVHAARLSALMRSLATAQSAVSASLAARKELLAGLEKLLEVNRAKVVEEEAVLESLVTRKEGVESKKKEVEDGIMRGLSAPSSPGIATPTTRTNGEATPSAGLSAPEVEGLTPPPPEIEAFTPPPAAEDVEEPALATADSGAVANPFTTFSSPDAPFPNPTGAETISEQPPNFNEPAPSFEPPPAMTTDPTLQLTSADAAAVAANDFLNSLASEQQQRVRQASTELPASADPRLKRRKMNHAPKPVGGDVDEDIFGGGAAGVDEDGVAALLAQ